MNLSFKIKDLITRVDAVADVLLTIFRLSHFIDNEILERNIGFLLFSSWGCLNTLIFWLIIPQSACSNFFLNLCVSYISIDRHLPCYIVSLIYWAIIRVDYYHVSYNDTSAVPMCYVRNTLWVGVPWCVNSDIDDQVARFMYLGT